MTNDYARPGDTLSSLCNGAERLLIVAPYIKADALSRVLSNISLNASLTCITQWTLQDIASGASDIRSWEIINNLGGTFWLRPSLHAKYFKVDDTILIGSANLTNSALGWSPSPNLEILCQAGDDFDDSLFQQELFQNSRKISAEEYERWHSALTSSAILDKAKASDQYPQMTSWRPTARDFGNVLLAYEGKADDIASFDEQGAANRDLEILRIPDGFTTNQVSDWALMCLLESSFANSVLQTASLKEDEANRCLAQIYSSNLTDARRSRETVHNWFASLAPNLIG